MLRAASFLCLFLLMGCQVYRNSGRSSFESAATNGGVVNSNLTTQSQKNNFSYQAVNQESQDCWTQAVSEPLRIDSNLNRSEAYEVNNGVQANVAYTIRYLDADSIQVCPQPHVETTHETL
jgi:hypothetical protein